MIREEARVATTVSISHDPMQCARFGAAAGRLERAFQRWSPAELAIACSFQKESSVIIDLATRISPEVEIFTLDTGVLFPETRELWRRIEERYDLRISATRGISLAEQARLHGDRLWERNPDLCCALRKRAPLRARLEGLRGWITGVRREQSDRRALGHALEWDQLHGLWKVNPLFDWSERDVYSYLHHNDVPYHELHDRGYASIGCAPCTAPGPGREGRWPGLTQTECGIHGRD